MKELIYHRNFMPAMKRFNDAIAVVDGRYTATFREHAQRVFRLAHALQHQLGIGRGDRFAVLALNSHVYLELYHAALLGAGIINPMNLRLSPKELEYIIRDSGAEVVFVDKHFAKALDAALKIGEVTLVRHIVLIGDGEGDETGIHDLVYENLLAAADASIPAEPEEEDPAVLMYTGGTTGLPKGVVLTQRAQMLNLYHTRIHRPIESEGTAILIQAPMFHVASTSTVVSAYVIGARTVLIPAFQPEIVLSEIERNQVTATTMVPTMIGMMLSHPGFSPDRIRSLKYLSYGASPMPMALLEKLDKVAPQLELYQGYGMTECNAVLTLLKPDDHRRGGKYLRSVGQPVPGVELSIRDSEGNELETGEIGEVCARGGNFMSQYWNKPEATKEAFKDGWYHSGDAGYVDKEGYLYLVDRVKDMIISGGENVYSIEVENAISNHPDVSQVAVIGIPDRTWGEAVHAVVVLREGANVTSDAIIAHAREQIAGYKVPKSVEFRRSPLPLSAVMKVLKTELRAPYWKDQEASIA
ncbi:MULTISPECIES: long-chain-fatty-acid--CoA ligase [Hyphobacterium]|uniref:Long-chain-fatty-acid--CoA ligase n=1 Tax=Hyphobacterium vulgare TaxID=1736751 RepID=A0ABV7A0M9_9PROT